MFDAATTDDDGYFEIFLEKATIDSYGGSEVRFTPEKRGYSNSSLSVPTSEIREDNSYVILPATRTGVVSGSFPDGHLPAVDKGASAHKVVMFYQQIGDEWRATGRTDIFSDNTYENPHIEPGTYKAAFAYINGMSVYEADQFQYYNGKATFESADTFVVEAGGEIHGISTAAWDGDRDHAVEDTIAPHVVSVRPGSADNPANGSVEVTFNEAMGLAPGTIRLTSPVDDKTLAAGTWSGESTTYTAPYAGLTAGRLYTVNVSGFKDEAGNMMTTDSRYQFAIQGGQIQRELTTGAGVTIAGQITPDAVLGDRQGFAHAQGTDDACDAIHHAEGQGLLLALHDITVSGGSFIGPLTVTIPVPAKYNGEAVSILHCKNGALEKKTATVQDGKVTFRLDSLSPIGIVMDDIAPAVGDKGHHYGSGGAKRPVVVEARPNVPVVASKPLDVKHEKQIITVDVTEAMAKEMIERAWAEAKRLGKESDGVALRFDVTSNGNPNTLVLNMERGAISMLKAAGVKFFAVNTPVVDVSFDTKALNRLFAQTSGTAAFTAKPAANLSADAKAVVGKRPAFDITISYKKDGETAYVTDLKDGTATLGIPYKPTGGEKSGGVRAVYVNSAGKPVFIPDSGLVGSKLVFPAKRFSVYAVGYAVSA